MKFMVVLGAVMSGLGKGVSASSIGVLLKGLDFKVAPVKIDPYLNCDAGTMSPLQHGELFVLDDGSEVDLDLGNYERFLDVTLTQENSITTGKVYKSVIDKERRGDYLGKTVQIVPHITAEIEHRLCAAAKDADVCVVELGGTVGDMESLPFLYALKNLSLREEHTVSFALVSYIPTSGSEQKTKPTQQGVQELHHHGIWPDMIFCRSDQIITNETREKIARMCHVQVDTVISCHNVFPIQEVPSIFHGQNVMDLLCSRLALAPTGDKLTREAIHYWAKRAYPIIKVLNDRTVQHRTVAIIGKYTGKNDTYLSVTKALLHAGARENVRINVAYASHLRELTSMKIDGIIIPGGFGDRGIEDKISSILMARDLQIPILGMCLGLQAMVIAAARSKLGWHDAHSTEFDPKTTHPVVDVMPAYEGRASKGSSMRLGAATVKIYDVELISWYHECDASSDAGASQSSAQPLVITERHRHRYEMNHKCYGNDLQYDADIRYIGWDKTNTRVEAIRWLHPSGAFCMATQYHPEFLSRPGKPSGPFLGLVKAMMLVKSSVA